MEKDNSLIMNRVEQPVYDEELIEKLKEIYSNVTGKKEFYNKIQKVTALKESESTQINKADLIEFERNERKKGKKIFNQEDVFHHIGNTGDIEKADTRLYVNLAKQDIIDFANIFVDKCDEKGLNYYFKYCIKDESKRSDELIIYSTLKDINEYIGILDEISKEKPEILERCGLPPILTGKIDNWIGMGDEPIKQEESYTKLRSDAIYRAIGSVLSIDASEWDDYSIETQDVGYEEIREAIEKEYSDIGIDIEQSCFYEENIPFYEGKEDHKKIVEKHNAYLKKEQDKSESQIEFDMLTAIGTVENMFPEDIKVMYNEMSKSRIGFLSDMNKNKINRDYRKLFNIDGFGKEVDNKTREYIINYLKQYFIDGKEMLPEMKEEYSNLVSMSDDEKNNDDMIRQADLLTKLNMLSKGKDFFANIGIDNNETEQVAEDVDVFLSEINQFTEEEKREIDEIGRKTAKEYVYTVLVGSGIESIEEMKKAYNENCPEEDKISEEDLLEVLEEIEEEKIRRC